MTVYSAMIGHNAEAFADLMGLHVPPGSLVADVTYGRGIFWKKIPSDAYRVLASDLMTGTDCRALPYPDHHLDALVLDPPYAEGMLRAGSQRITYSDFADRYALQHDGGDKKWHAAVMQLYRDAIQEACRVVRPGGVIVVKCQDEVSNHVQNLTHVDLIVEGREMGLYCKDLFIVVRPDRPTNGRTQQQEHARKRHSYFLVFLRDERMVRRARKEAGLDGRPGASQP
jgi:hypothetical protein